MALTDPQTQAEQVTEQQQIALDSIFSTVAANWLALKQASITPDYAKDIWRSLEKDVFPAISEIPVQEIKARKLVEALEPIKARGALETVRRLVQRINEIMIYAVNTGLIDANLASAWEWRLKSLRSKMCQRCDRKNCRSLCVR